MQEKGSIPDAQLRPPPPRIRWNGDGHWRLIPAFLCTTKLSEKTVNLKKHIKTLAAMALDKWNEPYSEINDTCAFCDDAVDRKETYRKRCQTCLCPPCLCDMSGSWNHLSWRTKHDPIFGGKWPSAVNLFLGDGCIYVDDAMANFPLVMDTFLDILRSLVEHGDVDDILVEKMEALLK